MRGMLLIARRELLAYLTTPMGYIIAATVLLIEGLLFNWLVLGGRPQPSTAVLEQFFYIASGITMFASVFISMRLLSEERQTGSLVLLMTSPASERAIVVGKWLAALAFLALIQLISLYMPLLIFVNGRVSLGHIACGYLGLILLGGTSLAVGLLGSALTRYQVLAVIISGLMMVFMVAAWLGANVTEPPLDDFFHYLALYNKHFVPFKKGILGLSHVVYYLSVTFFFLLATTKILEARRWR
jgi:ABC-2 type transport system permease protein